MQTRLLFFASLIVITLNAFQILYSNKHVLSRPYDDIYWKDRYEHSQYQLPLSRRIIGDDGLYAYAGYRFMHGDDPFSINVDKPPFGKYIIGLSLYLFQNPNVVNLLLGSGTIILLFYMFRYLLGNGVLALAGAALFFLDPLFFSQIQSTWLDLPQLFFFLLSIFLFFLSFSFVRLGFIVALFSGLALGLCIEIKPPLFLPMIIGLGFLYMVIKGKLRIFIPVALGITLGVFLPYLRYLSLGHSLMDVLRVHKFMYTFYGLSSLPLHPEAPWQVLLFGSFPDILSRQSIKIAEWSFLWPGITVIGMVMCVFMLVQKKVTILWKGVSIYILISLFIYSFVPFYPRYLLIVLPFLYIVFVRGVIAIFSRKLGERVLIGIFFLALVNASWFLLPDPKEAVKGMMYSFSRQFFQDLYYEYLDTQSKAKISQESFRLISQTALQDAEIQEIVTRVLRVDTPRWSNTGTVTFEVIYKTLHLGSFTEQKTAILQKEGREWKMVWDWDFLLDKFTTASKLETIVIPGNRGTITDEAGNIVARDEPGVLVSVNSSRMDPRQEPNMLHAIAEISLQSPVSLQNAYLENPRPDAYIALVTNGIPIDEDMMASLKKYPGLRVTPHRTRVYFRISPQTMENTFYEECCTRIYTSHNYHGVAGIEKEHDAVLSGADGGTLLLKDQNGSIVRTILDIPPVNGRNVQL